MGLRNRGPTFCRRGREGSLFMSLAARGTGLLIRRQVLQRKKGPIEHSSRFLEKFGGPRAAGATEVASNGATGAGAVSPGNKLLNRAVPAQCNARYANGRTVVNER